MDRASGLFPPQRIACLRDDVIVVVILLLPDKSPGLGFACMDEQAPAFSSRSDIHAVKNVAGYEIEIAGMQQATVQRVISPRIEHACLFVGATQHK